MFVIAALLSVPTMALGMGGMDPSMSPSGAMLPSPSASPVQLHLSRRVLFGAASAATVAQWSLVTPIQFWVGRRFHSGALSALRRGAANMDVLVSLSTTAAYAVSVLSILHCGVTGHALGLGRSENFFDTGAMVLTVVSLGKWLETSAKGRAGDAIARLLRLSPATALLLPRGEEDAEHFKLSSAAQRHADATLEIDAELVQVGDLLLVPPGSRLPCDGVVESGQGHVDVSMLTGESRPQPVSPGDSVQGGTLNAGGALRIRASAVGAHTAVQRIAQLVQTAQLSKAPIQGVADALASRFVPSVLLFAAFVLLAWWLAAGVHSVALPEGVHPFAFALLFAISTLVTACPCALGLATPTAVMVATGLAAQLGVLIKGGDALERGGHVGCVCMDKTGTLTQGKPSVAASRFFLQPESSGGGGEADALRALGEAEGGSTHPLARALRAHAEDSLRGSGGGSGGGAGGMRAPERMEELASRGVKCVLSRESGGVAALVGSEAWLRSEGVSFPLAAAEWLAEQRLQARSVACLALRGRLCAAFSICDPVREEAAACVRRLHSLGLSVHMLTGDNAETAHAVADQLGIPLERVHAGMLPADKAAEVSRLRGTLQGKPGGGLVAFVGDGVNDAPALAEADVGMAVQGGTDVAIEAAHFVLLRPDLGLVPTALELSRAALARIRANYAWALAYNMAALPVAAGIFYPAYHLQLPPWVAGAAMAFSSISVVGSSLALRLFRPSGGARKEGVGSHTA